MHSSLKRVLAVSLLANSVFAQRSLFINPKGLPELPTESQVSAAADAGLNITNIQSDVLVGMHKDVQLFFFFNITDVTLFKTHLANDLYPLVTSVSEALSDNNSTTMINLSFSRKGFDVLGVNATDVKDFLHIFANGQASDAENLGDAGGTALWQDEFKSGVHNVILIVSNDVNAVNAQATDLLDKFNGSMKEVYRLLGQSRPGSETGHEHFGFKIGISQPAVAGFNTPLPGQRNIVPLQLFLGHDTVQLNAPWANDGTFLAFRQLQQLVPEFDKFLLDSAFSAINGTSLTQEQGAELLGARMMGRWKSGAPTDVTPFADDPDLGNDPNRNNNFTFLHGFSSLSIRCPWSAHIRKVNPRTDRPSNADFVMVRSGIPYGPEVTDEERESNTSGPVQRGLAFVSYQSDLNTGFQSMQSIWANNPNFVVAKVGPDPIIGQQDGQPQTVGFLNFDNGTETITISNDFVVSRDGEYFFTPPISAILEIFTA